MSVEKVIKKKLKEFKERFPSLEEEQIERELIPLPGEEKIPIMTKKKKH
jgi:hypothetical protein